MRGGAATKRAILTTLVPQTLEGKQKILNVQYSVTPKSVFDKDGNHYARFDFDKPEKPVTVVITIDAEISAHDLSTAAARTKGNPVKAPAPSANPAVAAVPLRNLRRDVPVRCRMPSSLYPPQLKVCAGRCLRRRL